MDFFLIIIIATRDSFNIEMQVSEKVRQSMQYGAKLETILLKPK